MRSTDRTVLLAQAATFANDGKLVDAEAICRRLLAARADDADALHVFGVCLRRAQDFPQALEILQQAAKVSPANAAIQFELGSTLVELQRWDDAAGHFRRASELDPRLQPAFLNLGTILDRQERFDEALPWCQQAALLDPDCATAHYNLANVLRSLGRLDEASEAFRLAVKLAPDFASAHWNGALCHLLAGRFEQGWREYEWRDAAGEVAIDHYQQPRWRGQTLQGKTLLVHAEQGLGDEILFASCLPDVLEQAGRVVAVCEPRLAPIFTRSFPTGRVIGAARRKDRAPLAIDEPVDYQIPAGSLPGLLRPTAESFPARKAFLQADALQVEHWRERFAALGSGLKVGISWRAGGQPTECRKRTTGWDDWQGVLAVPGVQFVNVQYGECAAEIDEARRRLGVTIHDWDLADPLIDLDGFAAKLAALDLVVSVGNATVHLAGALGVPAWAILPVVPAWRWLLSGSHSPWYASVRLYRQTQHRLWSDVFARVEADLAIKSGQPLANRAGRAIGEAARMPAARAENNDHGAAANTASLNRLSDVTARVAQAETRRSAGDLAGAENILAEVLRHAPRDLAALTLMGIIAETAGRGDLAIRCFSRAASVANADQQVALRLAGALAHFGRTEAAIGEYRRAITLAESSYDAHFGLGHALRDAGRREEAIAAFAEAARLQPEQHKAFNALGGLYCESLRFDEAIAAFRRAIELKPDYMAAFNNLGQALQFQGDSIGARQAFERALAIDPACRQAAENLASLRAGESGAPPAVVVGSPGEAKSKSVSKGGHKPAAPRASIELVQFIQEAVDLYNQDQLEPAAALAEKIVARDPTSRVGLRILGVTKRKSGDLTGSLDCLRRGAAVHPNDYGLRFELGVTLFESNQSRPALEEYLAVTRLKPDFQPAYVNVTAVLEQQERFDEVIPWARKALALKPDCVLSNYNLANALRETAQVSEAIQYYRRAVDCDASYVKARWNLGMSYLLDGDYANGWPLFEHRGQIGEVAVDAYLQPRWNGESLAGRTVLVHGEQGIGDEVLFASCFGDLIDRAAKVAIVCEPRLTGLFRRSFPAATVYGYSRRKDSAPCDVAEAIDFQIPSGSLPQWFRPSRESFPRRESFLQPDPAQVAHWRKRLAALGDGLKVGVSWLAGGKPQERRKRSIPLVDWAPLLTVPGVRWINLQYGDGSAEIADVQQQLGVEIADFEDGDPLVDMDAFAAKIKALDLVISIGNATVHLAGAVGAPAWTILPLVPSWRWMIRGERNPWYANVRLFRQSVRGQWDDVFERLVRELGALAGWSADHSTPSRGQRPVRLPAEARADDNWLAATEYDVRTMVDSVGPLMQEAEAALAAGNLPAAETAFREVLRIAPRQYQALHGLGVVARQTGRNELAIRSFQRSLAMIEPVAIHHFNYAGALADTGRAEEAERSYRRAIELDGGFVLARIELGRLLARSKRFADAERELRKALAAEPRELGIYLALGGVFSASCRIDEAIECYRQALQIDPHCRRAALALGEAYFDDQRYADAIDALQPVAADVVHGASAGHLVGRALLAAGRGEEAREAFEALLASHPGHVGGLLELGHLARADALLPLAESFYRQAIAASPKLTEAHCALGITLASAGRLPEACDAFDRAIAVHPAYAAAHLQRALALVQQGSFTEGWNAYEWRWKVPGGPRARTCFHQPAWDGAPLPDGALLIHGEQGVGDEIMFATCYPDAIARAKQSTILCEPRLARLFTRSFPGAKVIGVPRGREHLWRMPAEIPVDAQIAAGSLPRLLRPTAASYPRAGRLLAADERQVAIYRERLQSLGPGLKVGISWLAGATNEQRRLRGDALAPWIPLLRTPGVQWIDAQYGDCRQELAAVCQQLGRPIHRFSEVDHLGDLDRAAAMLASLDLLISVGNTTVHLAAGLGVPTWVLLPPHGGWRWLAGRSDSPWYGSVRLFRQERLGQWNAVMVRAREELLAALLPVAEKESMRGIGPPHWPRAMTVESLQAPLAHPNR